MSVYYYAYGSNMLSARMSKRIPEAEFMDIASLSNWRLVWDKKSKDGSAKANLKVEVGSLVWGVVYTLPEQKINQLDEVEGSYQRIELIVKFIKGDELPVITYISEERDANLLPYDWYKKLILDGAQERSLPSNYVELLTKVESKPDMRKSAGENL